jgi:hypothetical protein
MAFEDNDIQTQLAQATPNAPTADDAQAAKDSASAQQLVSAASAPHQLSQPDASGWRHTIDLGKDATASRPVIPANFGNQMAVAFQNAIKSAPDITSQPGWVGKLLLGSGIEGLAKHGQPVDPASQIAPKTGPGSAGFDADTTRPTTAPVVAPRRSPVQGILDQLGDAAAAPGPGGALGGFVRAAKAGAQRSQEEQNSRLVMAEANSRMLHEQALVHKQGVDAQNESIKDGTEYIKALTTPVPGAGPDSDGKVNATHKTSDELNAMIGKGFDPTTQTPVPDGKELVKNDANGFPIYRTTYSLVTPAKAVKITPAIAKLLNENTGSDWAVDDDPEKQQTMSGVDLNALIQKANDAKAAARAAQVKDAKDQKEIDEAQNSKSAKSLLGSQTFTNALNGHTTPGKNGEQDPFAIVKTYDYFMTHPEDQAKVVKESGAANFSDAYMKYAGGENYFKGLREEFQKAQAKTQDTRQEVLEKARTNPAEIEKDIFGVEAVAKSILSAPKDSKDVSDQDRQDAADILQVVKEVKQSKIDFEKAKAEGKKEAATGYQGSESATTPEAFLKSLKPGEQETVKLIGEGRAGKINLGFIVRSHPEILSAVAKAYPNFDQGKVDAYIKAVDDFNDAKIANQLLSGGTVLQHLQEARELNTNASHLGIGGLGGPAYIAYKNKVDTLANELGQFYGADTVPGIESFKSTILSTLPGDREAAILTQAKSMTDRLNGLVTRWRNAAPSKVYEAKMPWISPEGQWGLSKLSPQFAQDYPELVQQGAQTPAAKREQKAAGANAPAQTQPKIGDKFMQNGHQFTVTAVENGKITGAE